MSESTADPSEPGTAFCSVPEAIAAIAASRSWSSMTRTARTRAT